MSEAARPATLPDGLHRGLFARKIPSLDGFRALAAWSVVGYHTHILPTPGDLGVLGFFVLSGFLITWLLLAEQERSGEISIKSFYIRRVLRIFPAYYAYWIVAVVSMALVMPQVPWRSTWAAFFYFSNYDAALNGTSTSALSHAWSLGIEEQFYLVWPALFLWLGRRGVRIEHALLWVIAGVWINRWSMMLFYPNLNWLQMAFDMRCDHLFIGCCTAVAVRRGAVPWLWRWLCDRPWKLALTFAALTASQLAIGWTGSEHMVIADYCIQPVLFAAIILQIVHFADHWSCRWLSSKPMAWLGAMSYSTYLWQQLPTAMSRTTLEHWPVPARLAVACGGSLAMACGSYYLIEKPFLRWKERIAARPAIA